MADDDTTKADRQWLVAWMMNSPDIQIVACVDLLGSVDEQHAYAHASYLLVQTLWGELAFSLEHPDAKPLDVATFEAGLRSAMIAYRNILKEDATHWPVLDQVLDLDAGGQVTPYVVKAKTACTK